MKTDKVQKPCTFFNCPLDDFPSGFLFLSCPDRYLKCSRTVWPGCENGPVIDDHLMGEEMDIGFLAFIEAGFELKLGRSRFFQAVVPSQIAHAVIRHDIQNALLLFHQI